MAKKSKRRGDATAAAATEADEREAPAADSGAPRKSKRRSGDAATAALEVAQRDALPDADAAADSGNGGTTEVGKKPKLKKHKKKNNQVQSPSAASDAIAESKSGKGCSDIEGAPRDAEVSTSPRFAEDPSCPEGNIVEEGSPEGKKPKLKKRKKNKQERSPSAIPDDGAAAADESGNGSTNREGATGDDEASMSARNGKDQDCPEVNIAEEGTPERKKRKPKKRKKNKEERSPSAIVDTDAVAAGKSGNDFTDGEGAPGDCEASTSPRNGEDLDCPEVNIAEMGTPERKKTKLKKHKKNKRERSPSPLPDEGAFQADKSGNVCMDGEGASGDAEVSMNTRNGEDPDCPEVNIAEKGTAERKKPKVKKWKKNKQEPSPSTVSDASDNMADKSGYGSTNVEAASQDADVTISPRNGVDPNCPEVNITEDSLEGNKDSSQKPKLKKREKNKQEQSPSAVSDIGAVATDKFGNSCTNEEGAPADADVTTSPGNGNDPSFPKEPEDSVEGKQGNEDNSQKPKREKRKRRKRNQVGVTEAPPVDVRWTDSITKMDGVIQPDLSDGKKIKKSIGSSICESEVTANDVSLTLFEDVKTNGKGKAVCLRARSDKSDFISKTPTSGGNHKEKVRNMYSLRGSLVRFRRKKLLILDLNGLLADINQDHHNAHMSHAKVRGKLVFKRPYCDDFLRFCFQNFELGIWSSRMKENVDSVVNILMRDLKQYLLFCWDLSKCTTTGCNTLENRHKPLVLKELKKLWNKEEPDLPWEQGEFSPSNTLLVDDSPYKALRNPLHTAIFPHPYSYHNKKDYSLGPGGDLRVYLENLAVADDVQSYVRDHRFGQPFIAESDPQWNFYVRILDKLEKSVIV